MKVAAGITRTHNPFGENYRASCLRENLTSSSYGEGLETGRESAQEPRQSLTRQCFGKFLNFDFPEAHTAAVATAPIGCDKQFLGFRIESNSHALPPAANGRHGELGGVMVNPDAYPTLIVSQVIDTIRHDFPEFLICKIVDIHLFRLSLSLPLSTSVFESPDQLLFLGVHRNDRKTSLLELLNLLGNIKKLRIPIRMFSAFARFSVRLHAIAELIQERPNSTLADLVALISQFLGQSCRTLAGPSKWRFRVATSDRINQLVKVPQQIRVAFRQSFTTAAGLSNAPRCFWGNCRRDTRLVEIAQASVDSSARKSACLRDKRRSSPSKNHGIRNGTKPHGHFIQARTQEFIFSLKHGKVAHVPSIQATYHRRKRKVFSLLLLAS